MHIMHCSSVYKSITTAYRQRLIKADNFSTSAVADSIDTGKIGFLFLFWRDWDLAATFLCRYPKPKQSTFKTKHMTAG